MQLHIDIDAVSSFSRKLGELHKSALPVAIRETLTSAAKDVKVRTMPETSKEFKKRQPNFFKANSKFEKANGFEVSKMKASVGFYENKLIGAGTNHAVRDLEQQEDGGTIDHKSLIPMKTARVNNRMVRANARLAELKNKKFVKVSSQGRTPKGKYISIKSKKQMFIRAAIMAEQLYGKNAFVLGNRNGSGSRTLSRIDEIRGSGRFTKNKYNLEISRTPLYDVRKGRAVAVKATKFMERATKETSLNINKFYIAQAQKQFSKFLK